MADQPPHKIEAYGIYDEKHGDLLGLPGIDGYCRSTMKDLPTLLFCLGQTKANVVKVTIEPVSGIIIP